MPRSSFRTGLENGSAPTRRRERRCVATGSTSPVPHSASLDTLDVVRGCRLGQIVFEMVPDHGQERDLSVVLIRRPKRLQRGDPRGGLPSHRPNGGRVVLGSYSNPVGSRALARPTSRRIIRRRGDAIGRAGGDPETRSDGPHRPDHECGTSKDHEVQRRTDGPLEADSRFVPAQALRSDGSRSSKCSNGSKSSKPRSMVMRPA